MKHLSLLLAGLLLGACSNSSNIADNGTIPPEVVTEAPGDWSALAGMIGRTPADSGLLTNSPVSVDLAALLGPDAQAYRRSAESGTALTRAGPVLVTIGADRASFLTILPGDHALQAGLKRNGRWQLWTTPAAQVPQPPAVKALLAG